MSDLTLNRLETDVLAMMLAGEHELLVSLRRQLGHCRIESREFTRVGFFTELAIVGEPLVGSARANLRWGDVLARHPSLVGGIGFVLFVDDGIPTMLEGYTYDEPWPASLDGIVLSYAEAERVKALAQLDLEVDILLQREATLGEGHGWRRRGPANT